MDYVVTSASEPRFNLALADCSLEHAESVVAQLLLDTSAPNDLELTDLTPVVEPAPEPVKRSLLDRLLGRNRA